MSKTMESEKSILRSDRVLPKCPIYFVQIHLMRWMNFFCMQWILCGQLSYLKHSTKHWSSCASNILLIFPDTKKDSAFFTYFTSRIPRQCSGENVNRMEGLPSINMIVQHCSWLVQDYFHTYYKTQSCQQVKTRTGLDNVLSETTRKCSYLGLCSWLVACAQNWRKRNLKLLPLRRWKYWAM